MYSKLLFEHTFERMPKRIFLWSGKIMQRLKTVPYSLA